MLLRRAGAIPILVVECESLLELLNLLVSQLVCHWRDNKSKKWMQTAEIKNGRLAMIAMGAFFHQNLLTNQGVIEQLKSHNFIPTTFPLH